MPIRTGGAIDEYKRSAQENKFIKNNGAVIRAINLLRTDYVNLVDVTAALEPQIAENEALDSLNYLLEGGYVRLVKIRSEQAVDCIGDDYTQLAGKLTAKGIQLVNGAIEDPCIDL